jgi:hypothetical protein
MFRLSLSHHQVCLFTKMCHTAFVMATCMVVRLKIYIDVVKIPNILLKTKYIIKSSYVVTCFTCYVYKNWF